MKARGRRVSVCAGVLVLLAGRAGAAVIYVDDSAPAGGDGASWASALNDLQAALAAASAGDEIRVGQGEYRPGVTRSATFRLKNGVEVRGGFAGFGAEDPDARDLGGTPSVLSGFAVNNVGDRVRHVVTAEGSINASAVLDGFVVRDGLADGEGQNGRGGGMLALGGPTVRDVIFTGNSAQVGGGAFVSNLRSPVRFERCAFVENSAAGEGGGVYADCLTLVVISDSLFRGNSAEAGGGLAVGLGIIRVEGATFEANEAAADGGALLHRAPLPANRYERCVFVGNIAGGNGGAACVEGASPRFVSSLFSGNRADGEGGAIVERGLPVPGFEILNSTIVGNTAGVSGGGVWATALTGIANTILWGNAAPADAQLRGGGNVQYSIVEGGAAGEGNLDADPVFVDIAGADGMLGTADDNARVAPGSPAIDAGRNLSGVSGEDLDLYGASRRLDDPATPDTGLGDAPVVDIGAAEFDTAPATTRRWITTAASGGFDAPQNWDPAGTPGPDDVVRLDLGLEQAWVFGRDTASRRLEIENASVLNVEAPGFAWAIAEPVVFEVGGLRVAAGDVSAPAFAVGIAGLLEAQGGSITGRRVSATDGAAIVADVIQVPVTGSRDEGAGVIEADTLFVRGATASAGVINVSGGRVEVEIGAGPSIPALSAGLLQLSGGALVITESPGFNPPAGAVFTLLDAASALGAFDLAFLPGFPDSRFYRVTYSDGSRGLGGVFLTVEIANADVSFEQTPESPLAPGVPTGAAVADFNGDRLLDLAVSIPAAGGPGSVQVLLNGGNDGAGAWLGFTASVQVTVGNEPSAVAAADFDGDGDADFAVANFADDTVEIYAGDPTGGGPGLPSFALDRIIFTPAGPKALDAGPFGGGPLIDLAIACAGANELLIVTDAAGLRGTFNNDIVDTGGEPTSVDCGDVDNDKDIDAIVATRDGGSLGGGAVTVIRNNGDGFSGEAGPSIGASPTQIRLTSIDPDNGLDFVTSDNSGTVWIGLNQEGGFGPTSTAPVGETAISIVSFDADGDGDLDLAVVVEGDPLRGAGSVVRLLRNNSEETGQAVFDAPSDILTGQNTVLIESGDVNGDGVADVIAVNGGGAGSRGSLAGSVTVLLNRTVPSTSLDLTGDGVVNTFDLASILGSWGLCPGFPDPCLADVTGDGMVNADDLCIILGGWTGGSGEHPES